MCWILAVLVSKTILFIRILSCKGKEIIKFCLVKKFAQILICSSFMDSFTCICPKLKYIVIWQCIIQLCTSNEKNFAYFIFWCSANLLET